MRVSFYTSVSIPVSVHMYKCVFTCMYACMHVCKAFPITHFIIVTKNIIITSVITSVIRLPCLTYTGMKEMIGLNLFREMKIDSEV